MLSENALKFIERMIDEFNLPYMSAKFKEREVGLGIVKEPIALRLDGVRFGKSLKGFKEPRDEIVHNALVESAKELLRRFNALMAYVISDEVNLIMVNYLPYGGRVFKLISTASSILSAHASLLLKRPLYFDSRIVKLNNVNEVKEYLYFRARVGINNYISKLYHKVKELGITPPTKDMLNYLMSTINLAEKANDWEIIGTCIFWDTILRKGFNPLTKEVVTTERRIIRETSDIEFCINKVLGNC